MKILYFVARGGGNPLKEEPEGPKERVDALVGQERVFDAVNMIISEVDPCERLDQVKGLMESKSDEKNV